MKKSIVLFICLCTGLTFKAMSLSTKNEAFGFKVFKVFDETISKYVYLYPNQTIEFLTKKIQEFNNFNAEKDDKEYSLNTAKFTSYSPIVIVCPKQLTTKFSKEAIEENIEGIESFLSALRDSIPYHDFNNHQLKIFEKKRTTLHSLHNFKNQKYTECTECTNTTDTISELQKFHDKNSYSQTLTDYIRLVENILWEKKIEKNNRKLTEILHCRSSYNKDSDKSDDDDDENDSDEDDLCFEDHFTGKHQEYLLRSITRLLQKIKWEVT